MSVSYIEDFNILEAATPNTAFIHHEYQTYALVESNLPFHIKVENDKLDDK